VHLEEIKSLQLGQLLLGLVSFDAAPSICKLIYVCVVYIEYQLRQSLKLRQSCFFSCRP